MPLKSLSSSIARLLVVAMVAVGCGGEEETLCDAIEGTGCDDCAGELTRCEFDGVEVTEQSCDGCQARVGLFVELCASGSEATAQQVDAEMMCEVVENTTVTPGR